jgi:AraC-like DNA-binding protein
MIFVRAMKREVEENNIESLTRVKDLLDKQFKTLECTTVNIERNKNLRPIFMESGVLNSQNAIDELIKYKVSNSFVSDIIFYFKTPQDKVMYTTSGKFEPDLSFNYLYKYENFNIDDLDKIKKTTIRPVEKVLVNKTNYSYLSTYIKPLPKDALNTEMYILYIINEDSIESLINKDISSYKGYVYIVDENDNLFFSTSKDVENGNDYDFFKKLNIKDIHNNINNINIENKSYSVVKVTSSYNNWSYVIAMDTKEFWTKVNLSNTIFIVCILFIFVIGVLLALVFSANSYKPIRVLLNQIGSNKDDKLNGTKDEFNYISNTFETVKNENKELEDQLVSKSIILRENAITKLLNTKISSNEESKVLLLNSELEFKYRLFIVMLFSFNETNNFECKDDLAKHMMKFVLLNVLNELINFDGQAYVVDMANGDQSAAIINMKEKIGDLQYVNKLSLQIKEFLNNYFKIDVKIDVGNIYNDVIYINKSFKEAKIAGCYSMVNNKSSINFYNEINFEKNKQYKYPIDQERELLISIKQGKIDKVEEEINEITKQVNCNKFSIEQIKLINLGVIGSILKLFNEFNFSESDYFYMELEEILIQYNDNVNVLKEKVLKILKEMCIYIQKNKESKNFDLINSIETFIEDNYSDNNLSLAQIADEFKITSSYLSRYFKDQTGYTVLQYIDTIRMNEAKKYLKETELNLNDIIKRVGYVLSFRVFIHRLVI